MRAESLFDTFEIVGLWWVPSHPDKKVHGTVTYRNGQSLELRMGGDFGIPDQPEPYELDVLQGDTLLHGQCTLIHLSLRTTRASSVAKELIYSAEQLIIGCHFDTPEKAGFKTSLFRFSLLEEWLDHEVFSYSYSDTGSEINVVGSV
ncbi:MAG: ApeA N-terminal domain 1-containing protein, partial [Archangium sp.]